MSENEYDADCSDSEEDEFWNDDFMDSAIPIPFEK